MPTRKLQLLPGINLERSQTLNQTQLALCNLIRYYAGLPQKLGGWLALNTTPFIGTARAVAGWADIIGNAYGAVGTEQRLQALIGGSLYDITPIAATDNPAVSCTTSHGGLNVTIQDASYSPGVGDWIMLQTHISAGGIVLYGDYQVQAVTDATHYVVHTTTNATSSGTGGAVAAYTTTNGSATVSVGLVAHGLVIGSIYTAGVSTTVATVVISGEYSVVSVTDANNFTITASTTANASTTASENSGNARIAYLLPTGYAVNTPLSGYGVGDYGSGDWGLSNTSQSTGILRQWSLDHWGQYLIATPAGGAIYYWNPPGVTPATVISSNAPLYNNVVFVMPQEQILVSCGAETGGTLEPTLVRWCDAGDFTTWTATATNQAGSFQIPSGSKIVGALAIDLGAMIWTDVDLWTMSYQGLPFVFGFSRLATGCGLLAQRAAVVIGAQVIWLSSRGFFSRSFSGVMPMECPVIDFLLNNLDQTQVEQVHAAPNTVFNEAAWFFPIAPTSPIYSASAPIGYIKLNYVENVWDYGQSSQYQRTAWVGRSPLGNPVGADTAGLLQQHEVGYDANGTGMRWSWQTGYFDISDGEDYVFVDLLIPDFVTVGSPAIQIEVLVTNYPDTAPVVYGPYTVTPDTQFISPRVRGRQVAIAVSGSDLGTFNRLGAIRYRFAPDGRN